ncbi:2-hydroxyacid dehydrogenase [Acidisoma silvae]|uniref:3-phosphoglycerate dehydrogenase n=1 Tax=Acidisoma silvae TaxID=2802396 RepID=A0A963YMY0_9PROT|nr:NAD(P)-dependent oxidoreductase [Acidisoma silvae]MCB8873727.1 3-phosphoglycerate dehydrogenase [Acidisoma silvae]
MKGIYADASGGLAEVFARVYRADDPHVTVHEHDVIAPEQMAGLYSGHDFMLNDHTFLPTDAMAQVVGLKHVIFLGTGARSYMDVEGIESLGIKIHTIRGYGDTAVGEHAIALMWAAARNISFLDRSVRAGIWPRGGGIQLTGRTLGLYGFGGIAAEVARIAVGSGMRVIAWNRTPRSYPGVEFVDLPTLLAQSDVLSLHLLLTDETRHALSAERIAAMKPGAILVNTARAGVVDTAAMIAALQSGQISHAALDVFDTEPLPAGDVLTTLPNVTLTSHDAFNTPEASENLVRMGLDIAKRLAQG